MPKSSFLSYTGVPGKGVKIANLQDVYPPDIVFKYLPNLIVFSQVSAVSSGCPKIKEQTTVIPCFKNILTALSIVSVVTFLPIFFNIT